MFDEPRRRPVTLASLQTNSELFARPVIQLGTLRAASSVPVRRALLRPSR